MASVAAAPLRGRGRCAPHCGRGCRASPPPAANAAQNSAEYKSQLAELTRISTLLQRSRQRLMTKRRRSACGVNMLGSRLDRRGAAAGAGRYAAARRCCRRRRRRRRRTPWAPTSDARSRRARSTCCTARRRPARRRRPTPPRAWRRRGSIQVVRAHERLGERTAWIEALLGDGEAADAVAPSDAGRSAAEVAASAAAAEAAARGDSVRRRGRGDRAGAARGGRRAARARRLHDAGGARGGARGVRARAPGRLRPQGEGPPPARRRAVPGGRPVRGGEFCLALNLRLRLLENAGAAVPPPARVGGWQRGGASTRAAASNPDGDALDARPPPLDAELGALVVELGRPPCSDERSRYPPNVGWTVCP